jgi:hypothetical protein
MICFTIWNISPALIVDEHCRTTGC